MDGGGDCGAGEALRARLGNNPTSEPPGAASALIAAPWSKALVFTLIGTRLRWRLLCVDVRGRAWSPQVFRVQVGKLRPGGHTWPDEPRSPAFTIISPKAILRELSARLWLANMLMIAASSSIFSWTRFQALLHTVCWQPWGESGASATKLTA